MTTSECVFCKEPAPIGVPGDGVTRVECPRCGHYSIGTKARMDFGRFDPRICAWVRACHERGESAEFRNDAIKKLQETLITPSVPQKLRLLLKWISSKSKFPGDGFFIKPDVDWPVAWCSNRNELVYYFDALVAQGLLEQKAHNNNGLPATITPAGWHALEVSRGEEVEEDLIFVAMQFGDKTNEWWLEGFKPGINNAGYRAHRVDQEKHTERIDMKVLGDIRRSRIVVADATAARPNVYYEAGYAEALGRPVIWTVKEQNHKMDMQFDTRQFPHIRWADPSDLAKQLEDFIAGLIGRRKQT